MERRAIGLVVLVCTALVAAAGAAGSTTGPASGEPAATATRELAGRAAVRLPAGFSISLQVPPAFTRACCLTDQGGRWLGPSVTRNGVPVAGRRATFTWRLVRETKAASIEVATRRALRHGWPVDEAGAVFVPHLVNGREVGTVAASFLLARAPEGSRYELAFAVPLGQGRYATIQLENAPIARQSTSSPDLLEIDGTRPGTWLRDELRAALYGATLEGNLWPRAVSLRGQASGRAAGSVSDSLGHPLVAMRVTLDRRSGSRWTRARVVQTDGRGRFSVGGMPAGTYRASVTNGGVSAFSRPLPVRAAR